MIVRMFATLAVVLLSVNAASARPPGIGTPPGPVVAPEKFVGTWYGVDPDGNLVKVVIGGSGTSLTINPFRDCNPTPCDDGTQPLGPGGSKFVDTNPSQHLGQATFKSKGATMLVEVDGTDNGHEPSQLVVRLTSTFVDHRKTYETTESFTKTVVSHHVDPFVGTWYGEVAGGSVALSIAATGSSSFSAYFAFTSNSSFISVVPSNTETTCTYSGTVATCNQGIALNLSGTQTIYVNGPFPGLQYVSKG